MCVAFVSIAFALQVGIERKLNSSLHLKDSNAVLIHVSFINTRLYVSRNLLRSHWPLKSPHI